MAYTPKDNDVFEFGFIRISGERHMRTSDIKERIFSAVATQFSIEDWLVHMTGDGLDCKVISPDEIGTSEGKLKLVLQFEPNK